MSLFNLAWKTSFFWEGRAPSLREQALVPIQDPTEMGETLPHLSAKLAAKGTNPDSSPAIHTAPTPEGTCLPPQTTNDYPALFTAAFGSSEITPEKIGLAIESYVLTLLSSDSKFDRVMQRRALFTPEEQRGFFLFSTEYDPRFGLRGADCFHCHGGPLFQNPGFANNGLDSEFKDLGRAKVTGKDWDKGKFAIPSLRNVALTAPYMHDGRFATLEEVVEHYNSGLKRSPTLDPNLAKHPTDGLRLTPEDKKSLVAFLKTLTDDRFVPKTEARLAAPNRD
jgi:cytochrome c peroxidase